jgi:hypothetical protein
MTRGQHGHALNAWLCGFKNGQPLLEATGTNTGTAGAFAGIGHLSSLKQMCRQRTFTGLDRDVVNRRSTGHPGIAQFLHFHCQNSTGIGDLFLLISQEPTSRSRRAGTGESEKVYRYQMNLIRTDFGFFCTYLLS